MGKMQHKVNFQEEYSWFKFKVFLFLDWLPKEPKLPYCLLIAHKRRDILRSFPRILVWKWNANSFQDLYSVHQFHFQPLHYDPLQLEKVHLKQII